MPDRKDPADSRLFDFISQLLQEGYSEDEISSGLEMVVYARKEEGL